MRTGKSWRGTLSCSRAGNPSTQSKWEVNTQPQEAINCSRDQLGPSRWPQPCLLWSCPVVVSQLGGSRPGPRKQRGSFICSAVTFFHQRFPTSRLIKPFIALPLSSSPVQVIRRDNYSPLKKARFYWRRLIRQDPSKAANPRQFTLNTLHHHSLSPSPSLSSGQTAKIKVNHKSAPIAPSSHIKMRGFLNPLSLNGIIPALQRCT